MQLRHVMGFMIECMYVAEDRPTC